MHNCPRVTITKTPQKPGPYRKQTSHKNICPAILFFNFRLPLPVLLILASKDYCFKIYDIVPLISTLKPSPCLNLLQYSNSLLRYTQSHYTSLWFPNKYHFSWKNLSLIIIEVDSPIDKMTQSKI
jgi:hypothetical protein